MCLWLMRTAMYSIVCDCKYRNTWKENLSKFSRVCYFPFSFILVFLRCFCLLLSIFFLMCTPAWVRISKIALQLKKPNLVWNKYLYYFSRVSFSLPLSIILFSPCLLFYFSTLFCTHTFFVNSIDFLTFIRFHSHIHRNTTTITAVAYGKSGKKVAENRIKNRTKKRMRNVHIQKRSVACIERANMLSWCDDRMQHVIKLRISRFRREFSAQEQVAAHQCSLCFSPLFISFFFFVFH